MTPFGRGDSHESARPESVSNKTRLLAKPQKFSILTASGRAEAWREAMVSGNGDASA